MEKQQEYTTNDLRDFLRKVPVLSVPNALRLLPYEHEENLYRYNVTVNGKQYSICVNKARQQWIVDKHHHGDDAASLLSLFAMSYDDHDLGLAFFDTIATRILKSLKESQETPKQRIPLKSLPFHGRTWLATRYDNAINRPFLQGLCETTLKKQCYVVYRANCFVGEEDKETKRLIDLMYDAKDLKGLSQEDKRAIKDNFTTAIALRNVNGGIQLYTGEISYPEKSEGFCLFGSEKVEFGENLYVYENIMDYLAMMELRHMNGVDLIMPQARHLIINGENNFPEALPYIHKHCDYLNVVCMFPNDEEGHALFEKVNRAANGTVEDASQRLYADKGYFSLYAKTADIFSESKRESGELELKQMIEQMEQHNTKNEA